MSKSAKPAKTKTHATTRPQAYPAPGKIGGLLIRQVIAQLRSAPITLPVTSHILIAASAGSDSIALATLLIKYGRRVVDVQSLTLLHVNHGWRGAESDADARLVRELGKKWDIPVVVKKVKPLAVKAGSPESWEEIARNQRKAIFEKEAQRRQAIVLTAHQADDVAETLLWRLMTGGAKTHGGGIAARHGVEVRPLLQIRKAQLQAFLREEGQEWREDSTNHSGRFLRSRMRLDLMPVIERLFPRAVEHLVALALAAQAKVLVDEGAEAGAESDPLEAIGALFEASGLKLRRPNWEALTKQLRRKNPGIISLPGGWEIYYDPKSQPRRWILTSSGP